MNKDKLIERFGPGADPSLCDRCHEVPPEVGYFCKPCAALYKRGRK